MKILILLIFIATSWTGLAQSFKEKRKVKREGNNYKEKIVKKQERETPLRVSATHSRNYTAHVPAHSHFRAHSVRHTRNHSHRAYSKKHVRRHTSVPAKDYKKIKRKYRKGKSKIKYEY